MTDEVKKLYTALLSKGYSTEDLGDESTFRSKMSDKNNRRDLYDWVSSKGNFRLGDYDTYESRLTSTPTNTPTAQLSTQQVDTIRRTADALGKGTVPVFTEQQLNEGLKSFESLPDLNAPLTGFWEGAAQGGESLVQGGKYYIGDTGNMMTANAQNYKDALDYLIAKGDNWDASNFDADAEVEENQKNRFNERVAQYRETMKQRKKERENMGFWDKLRHIMDDPDAPDMHDTNMGEAMVDRVKADKPVYLLKEALEESGGDVKKARSILEEKSKMGDTWAQRWMREASDKFAQMRPVEGAAWWGQMLPQMTGQATALGLSAIPATRGLGAFLGAASTTGLMMSSAGASMNEARAAGATDAEVRDVGMLAMAIEGGSEALPFGRLMNRVGKTAIREGFQKAASEASEAELNKLLKEAKAKIGGKFLSYNTGKELFKDVVAEGASEVAAGMGEQLLPLVYGGEMPTLQEYFENAFEQGAAGLVMGGFLGGGSHLITHYGHQKRREAQGGVAIGEYTNDNGGKEWVEVTYSKGGKSTIMHQDGTTEEVSTDKLDKGHFFTMDEWKKGIVDANRVRLESAYASGKSATDPAEMQSIGDAYDAEFEYFVNTYGTNKARFVLNDPMGVISQLQGQEQEDALRLAEAYNKFSGVSSRFDEDAKRAGTEAKAVIDSHVSQTDGMIHKGTLKDGRNVYIVSGEVVQKEDGSVDVSASSGSVAIADANSGELTMVSPDEFVSTEQAVNPEDELDLARQTIYNEYQNKKSDALKGSVAVGDTHTILDAEGNWVQVQVVADNGDGTVNVTMDGQNVVPLSKDELIRFERAERRMDYQQQHALDMQRQSYDPTYYYGDNITFTDEDGSTISGKVVSSTHDGVQIQTPSGVLQRPLEMLNDAITNVTDEDGNVRWDRANPVGATSENEGSDAVASNETEGSDTTPQAELSEVKKRMPKNDKGELLYEQAEADDAWDAILEDTDNDVEMAQRVANEMVAQKEAELKAIEKKKTKSATTPPEKIAIEKARKAEIAKAKQDLEAWKNIAGTTKRREEAAKAEERRRAEEAAAQRKAEEERLKAEREEALRQEREALNGVPDMVDDTPQDARARGYRRVGGHKVERQSPVRGVAGKDVQVKFSNKAMPQGRVMVIDANELQPSHTQGQRNAQHFLDEAQPKERMDSASMLAAQKIAENIRPEEITSSVTAYTGAPTTNSRGEVIQGNSRSDALKQMWDNYPEQAAKYKQYLIDHAEELGLDAEAVAQMERPVLVNMLEVADEDAITLGQFVAQDTESGGVERIKAKNVLQKMGSEVRNFANRLLQSADEETSFAGLIDANGANVIQWMAQKGYITPTQQQSAYDGKGNLTAEAKNDLRSIMYQSIFKGGNTQLEEMFNALPVKAQKAILATAYRDFDSPVAERMIEEIQSSISAFYALSQDSAFASAKNITEARAAVEAWKNQYQMDDVTGESYLPSDKFSNFALHLATMYKGENQSVIQGTFNKMFDLIQGIQEADLFNENPDTTPRTLVEAIKEILNIDYNGQLRSNVLGDNHPASQRGQQGSTGNAASGEQNQDGQGTDDGGRRTGISDIERGGQRDATDTTGRQHVNSSQKELDENGHPFVVASNGTTTFGVITEETGLPTAPIKLSEGFQNEDGKGYGLLHIEANHGQQIRNAGFSSVEEFVSFVATNYDENNIRVGKRRDKSGSITYLIQVTDEHDNTLFIELSRDGSYWNVNSGGVFRKGYSDKKRTVVKTEPQQPNNAVSTDSSLSESGDNGITPTEPNGESTVPFDDSKVTDNSSAEQKNAEENVSGGVNELIAQAESETDVTPTEGQKKAGNYKKGKVKVAGYEISIEQPKGSVRRGVDANGKAWEQTMHNTYGYFLGTEGVDGDHIDVFLANDVDAWNGEQVFVVDQYNEDGSFDEHKVMLGFNSIEDAQSAYLSNYEDGWADKHNIVVTGTSASDFKKWVDSSHRKTKAFAEYKTVKTTEGQSTGAPTHETETLDNGDVHITNRNSRGEVTNVSVERDGKIVSVDSYQDGALFERTEYDADGNATKVTRYDKKGEVVGVQEYEGGVAKTGKRRDIVATEETAQSTWDNLSPQERLEHAEINPLTAEEIDNSTADEVNKANAIAYLNGTQNLITQISYLQVYEDVRIRPTSAPSDNGVGNRPQLAEANSNASTERGRGGESRTSPLRTGKEGGTDRERVSDGGAHSEGESDLLSGESGDNSVRGSQSSVDGVSSRGANSGRGGTTRSKRSDGGRDGRSTSHRNTEVAGKQSSSIDEELNAALGDFKAVLSEFTRAGRETLSISIAGLNNKQLEILPKLISAGTKVGYAFIKKGVTQLNAWAKEMKALIGNHLSDAGLTDVEVDAFIEELWNSHFPIGEEVHTIGEWASILGMEKTRSAIKSTLKDKKALQDAAEGIRVKIGDATNIAETLPFLLPQQQDDVLKAETQFFDESHNDREHAFGKGYMFTNGTGTGKTYTGLGIVKRFIKQGKGRILIVTPSQQKVTDWIGDAKNLNIPLRSLDDFAKEQGTTATQTSGEGAVITTFANFRENAALLEGVFDLVVYDESHRILENKQGTETAGARQHYMVTNRDANSAFMRLREINPKYKAYREAQDEYNSVRDAEIEKAGSSKNIPGVHNPLTEEYKRNYPKLYKAKENLLNAEESWGKEEIRLKEQAEKDAKVTKVVFLSATPFNTRDNLDYAERYIFTYPEEDPNTVGSYKHQSPRTRFYLEYFGGSYKFRYGRLEKAGQDSDVIARQEIAFSDYLQNTLQTMSGRVIDSEYDYSRDFPTVSLAMGDRINDAISSITEDEALRPLWSARHKVWYDYNYSNALFETMKISAMAPRLKQHLDAGRKVVIFHRRVETKHPLTPPFALMLSVADKEMHASQNAEEKKALKEAILKFRANNADLLEWEKTLNYSMPREQLAQMFGNDKVLFFSGKESAKVKNDAVSKFNDDNSGKNIIVIQEASGKEGISLHDRTGKHQRVVITLALPQSPITALQIEGRIYRIGNKSNAIFEYPILGLDSEMVLFGQNFNKSVSTTENLALGSQARNLRDSFARGIEERSGDIPIEEQGVGGKEADTSKITEQTPYDNAILDYYTNQKITARRDQREGVDYYPTPEPLGFMMNEWGRVKEGDELLEPSAGHGAIARYAPTENKLTAIEPSGKLFSRLQIKVGGASGRNFVNDIFENYNIVNKHDVILMNPPFGVAGKLAAEHVEKAFKHLTEGGRIVAIVPEGKAQDRIGKWLDSQKDAVVVGEVLLPDVTFKQAGTNIKCRVVVIDKITNERKRLDAAARKVTHNLGYVETIEEFFNELQNVSMPDRTIDTQLIMQKRAKRYVGDLKDIKGVKEVVVNQDSVNVRTKGWRNFFIDWSNYSGNALKDYLARQYKDFANKIVYSDENSREIMLECQSIICKLANMTEDEMERYISNMGKGDTLYRSDNAIKNRIEALFNQAISGEFKGRPISIGRLTDAGKAYLEQISGVAFKEYVDFVLNPSDLIHIYKDHFGNNEKDKGQNIPLDIEDIRNLVDVISNPDKVVFFKEGEGSNRNMFYFFKEAEDGTYNLMEIYSDRKGNLTAKTFYKTRKDATQRVMDIEKSLLPTSETYSGAILSDAKIPQMFEIKQNNGQKNVGAMDATTALQRTGQEDVVTREGEGSFSDDALSGMSAPMAKMLGASTYSARQRKEFAERARKRMVRRAESIAKELHLDNVEVVTDVSVLPEGKKRGAKGFYSKSTDKITIVVPNHAGTYDIQQTVLHEAVAHYGLRQLFGTHFDTFLDNVFENVSSEIRNRIIGLARQNGWDFRTATEEYLATLAEDVEFSTAQKSSWWSKIKGFFLKMLADAGVKLDFTLSDNELRYILWRSYQNLANPGKYASVVEHAADVAKQHDLKVGNYRDSATDLDAVAEQVREREDVLFREDTPRERAIIRDRYERRVKTGWYQTQEALQDSMLGLKEAMQAIVGDKTYIEDIEGFENAYLGENRLSSVNKAEIDWFVNTHFKPLYEIVKGFASTEEEQEVLEDYMFAKHGLERNRVMAEREAQKAYDAYKAEHPRGSKTLSEFVDEYRKQDYAGLTALTRKEDVADAEAEAQRMVAIYEIEHSNTDLLWMKWNQVTKAILEKTYKSGIISKKTFDKISGMYEYYVPLRGFDETTSMDEYAYLGKKDNGFNPPVKVAGGRRSKADNPFAYLESMAESAIMQGNRNELVKQKMLNFVLNHPSDLFSVSELWLEHDDVTDEWKPVFPTTLSKYDSPEEIQQKMDDFEARMEELAEATPDKYKRGRDAKDIPYRVVDKATLSEHQVIVKRNGRSVVITVNGNPRAAQALNGMTNPDNHAYDVIGEILRAGESVNRWLSANYTTRNPDFVVGNLVRDTLYTNIMVWVKESRNYATKFHKNWALCFGKVWGLYSKYQAGTLDMSNELEAMFKQFMLNGGETGYMNMSDVEAHKKEIAKKLRTKNAFKNGWEVLKDFFDYINRCVENITRFAAFVTSRQMGRSIDRSIYDAKEISVNFNKKGSGGKFFNATGQTMVGNASAGVSAVGRSGFVFWNAALQGSTNFGRQVKRHPVKALSASAAMFMLGALVAHWLGDDDDDDYYNLPDYVRRSNIIFPVGKSSYASIPLPIEFRAMYGMGELMMSVMKGKERKSGWELGMEIASQASQVFPIDVLEGGGGWTAFVPSSVKPIVDVTRNVDWTGLPIYKDNPYNENNPEYTEVYSSANKQLVGIFEWLNNNTGGDAHTKGAINFNPAGVEYLLESYFGGYASTADKMIKMGETWFGNREYDPRSFLLWNRLVKSGDERTEQRYVNDTYFKLKKEADVVEHRLRGYKNDTKYGIFDYAEKISYLEQSPEYGRYEIFKPYQRKIEKYQRKINEANKKNRKDRVEEWQEKIYSLKHMIVEEVEAYDKMRKQ